MAIPTFTSVVSNKGPVGGDNIVVITGTNFRTPTVQPTSGPSVAQPPSVTVTFNGEPATLVEVVSATTLYVVVPPYRGMIVDDPLPAVNLVITNVDDSGVQIGSEAVTAAGAFTYKRPLIHETADAPTETASAYTLVTAAFIFMLRRQVFQNVVHTTHVDYTDANTFSVSVAKIPALIIQGPTISRDTDRWHNEATEVDLGGGATGYRKPPFVAKMSYTFIGVSDNEKELLNMQGSFQECFERLKFLDVDVDPLDPAKGRAHLVMQLTQYPQNTDTPNENNLRTWSASCEIRGVEVSVTDVFARTVDSSGTDITMQQVDGTLTEVIPT